MYNLSRGIEVKRFLFVPAAISKNDLPLKFRAVKPTFCAKIELEDLTDTSCAIETRKGALSYNTFGLRRQPQSETLRNRYPKHVPSEAISSVQC